MLQSNRSCFVSGMHSGIPIALGYFAVSFTLGIAAKNAGLTAIQAGLASFLTNASAGEYAGFTVIAAGGTYLEMAVMILVANARYLLMSCALTQKVRPETSLLHRMLIAFDITDEIFGVNIAQPGYLNPWFAYGVFSVALPGWSLGTALGVMMGNLLPTTLVSALSVGLYGMFLAIIIPPARTNKVIAVLIPMAMILSYLCSTLPVIADLSAGTRIILLTILLSTGAALLFPIQDKPEEVTQ